MKLKLILVTLIFVFFSAFSTTADSNVIDFSTIDFEKDGLQTLNGTWAFYYERFLDPETEFNEEPDLFVELPGYWVDIESDGIDLDRHGFATYSVKILLPSKGLPLALKFREVMTACDIYVDGAYMSSIGAAGENEKESRGEIDPHDILFTSEEDEIELMIHFSNFQYRDSGLPRPINIGLSSDVFELSNSQSRRELFIIGAILIMSFYHFFLYLFRRENPAPLYFALFCLLVAIRTAFTGETLFADYIPDINFEIVILFVHGTVYLAFPMFFLFFRSMFEKEMNRIITYVLAGTGLFLFLFSVVTPAKINSWCMNPYLIFVGVGLLYVAVLTVLALLRRKAIAIFFLSGLIILIGTYINDVLYNLHLVNTIYMASYGIFAFIFFQSLMLSLEFSKAFRKVEVLSKKLLNMDELKDEFLANTSHELRTPLNGIIGIADSMIADLNSVPDSLLLSNLSMISISGKRLSYLVDDILDFSKLKNHDISLNISKVDLRVVVDLIFRTFGPVIQLKSIKLINDIPEGFPPLNVDENRIQQVLYNLIGNSVKFTNQGHIRVMGSYDDTIITINVEDTGIGIPVEKQASIFNSFEQVDPSLTKNYEGTGLGLAISRKLINLHGGSLNVESVIDKGSIFNLTLPRTLKLNDSNSEQISYSENNIQIDVFPNLDSNKLTKKGKDSIRVLIVDDDPINLQVIKNYFSFQSWELEFQSSGKEVFQIVKNSYENNHPFDLLIIDLMMPGIHGFDVIKLLRTEFSKTELPILVLTAMNRSKSLLSSLDFGANDYIQKPFDKDELFSRVDNLLKISLLIKENNKVHNQIIELEKGQNAKLQDTVKERTMELTTLNKKLKKQAITDQLTGLANRLRVDEAFTIELNKAERYGSVFSIIMMDIDHFKSANDNFGHQIGDIVLKDISEILSRETRKTDLTGRWGGEEFIVICPETKDNEALILAEKLRKKIDETKFLRVEKVTASFGVSQFIPNDSYQSLLERADQAMYKSKSQGRNCCHIG